jgi:hypothetical protein
VLQIIGLIVAVYALVRLAQVPVEMTVGKETWLGFPFQVRFLAVAGASGIGIAILLLLTLALLFQGSGPSGRPF